MERKEKRRAKGREGQRRGVSSFKREEETKGKKDGRGRREGEGKGTGCAVSKIP